MCLEFGKLGECNMMGVYLGNDVHGETGCCNCNFDAGDLAGVTV